MLVYVFMDNFSRQLQEKFGLEVIINNEQFLLKREDGRFYKYPLNKEKNGYIKTKLSAKDDVVQNIVKNKLIEITSPLTASMKKNVLAFEKLNYMYIENFNLTKKISENLYSNMQKKDLKSGMIVKFANCNLGIIMKETYEKDYENSIIYDSKKWYRCSLNDFNEDFTYNLSNNKEFDIVAVYQTNFLGKSLKVMVNQDLSCINDNEITLLWEKN